MATCQRTCLRRPPAIASGSRSHLFERRLPLRTIPSGQFVVAAVSHDTLGPAPEFKLGDVTGLLFPHFLDSALLTARIARPSLTNPGAFEWQTPTMRQPKTPRFEGHDAIPEDRMVRLAAEEIAIVVKR